MVLGAHLEYVVGSLPGPPASSSRSDDANAAADEAASLRPEVVHLRLSSQIIEQIAQQLEDTTDEDGLQVEVESGSISLIVGSRSFPLSRSSEYSSTPHDLFRLCPSSSSSTEPTPLLSVGPIAYQLSARATTGASDLAAERLRLKGRRDEEDARRTSNSAVLLEPNQIGGKKGKKADRSRNVISTGASPAIRRSAPLGLASASASSTQQNTKVNSKNDAPPAAQQVESDAFSATNPSLRTRLIQLLAMSPTSLSAITSQLGSSAAALLPSLASQDGQQMYVLKDDLCVEVRIAEWPEYTDAEVRRAVSDRVNLGLRKRRVGRSHEAWSRLWPDGKIQRVVGASEPEQKSAEQQQSEIREAEGVPLGSEPAGEHESPATAAVPKKKKPTTLQRVAKAAKGKKSASTVTAAAKQNSGATVKAASKVASSSVNGRVDKDRQVAKGADDADLPIRKKPRLQESKSTEVTAAAKKATSAQRARSPALERIPRKAESSNSGKASSTTSAAATSSSVSRKQQAVDKAAAAAEAKRKRLEERARNLDYTDSSEEEEVERAHASSHHVSASSARRGRSPSRPSRDSHTSRDASTSHSQKTAERPRSEAPAQHRGVGPGAHAHSEPWLDIRTTADFARLAERFRRDYAEYSAGKDRVRKEGEWLEAEKKAIEIEEQNRREEEKARAEREKEQRAAIAAAAAAATSASVEADESPEEGETSPVLERDMEHFHQGSFSDASRGGAPARSASTNPTTRSPSPAATWRDANETVGKELSIAAASAAAAGDSGGVGTAIGPPMGPMTFLELERLVRRVRDLEGQLWRMKRALVDFKRRVEGTEWDRDRDRGDGRDRNRNSGREWERGRERDRDWRGERQRS